MIYAAILAGGVGSRMGADKPKQFLEFAGCPVIVHTARRFLECEAVDKIIVMTPQEWCGYTEGLLAEYLGAEHFGVDILVAPGGETRNDTLMNAVQVIEDAGDLDEDTIIITHDAVRPFVTERMIRENITAAMQAGACETAFPATDTIIETDDGKTVSDITDRSRLFMTQTPQSFRAKHLRDLYLSLSEEEKNVLTDAAGIYIMKDEPVAIVRGESYNIKITYPQDIHIAEAIAKTL